jgi:hypothetical protein
MKNVHLFPWLFGLFVSFLVIYFLVQPESRAPAWEWIKSTTNHAVVAGIILIIPGIIYKNWTKHTCVSAAQREGDSLRFYKLIGVLRQNHHRYHRNLRIILQKLHRLYGAPFSLHAYDRSLTIAVLYPALIALMCWALSGAALRLGDLEILPEETSSGERLWIISGIAVFGLLSAHDNNFINWPSRFFSKRILVQEASNILLMTISAAFCIAAILNVSEKNLNILFLSLMILIIFFGGMNNRLEYLLAFSFFLICGTIENFFGSSIFLYSILGSSAYCLVFLPSPQKIKKFFSIFTLIISAYITIKMSNNTLIDVSNYSISLIFLIILPLLNGFWHWMSLSITRILLERNRNIARTKQRWQIGATIVIEHIILAGLCLLGINFILVFISSFYQGLYAGSGGEHPFLSLRVIFNIINDESKINYYSYWIYAMFLLSWMPSIIHIFIILQSISGQKGDSIFARIHERMGAEAEKGSPYYQANTANCVADMFCYYSTRWLAPFGVILIVFCFVFFFCGPFIIETILYLADAADDFGTQAGNWLGHFFLR